MNGESSERRTSIARRVRRSGTIIGLATLAFYLVPPPGDHSLLFDVVWFVGVLAPVVFLTVRQIAARAVELRRKGVHTSIGLETLTNVLFVVALAFAAIYFAFAERGSQVEGIATHTDALYFSMTILSTVGFGDIRAVGQGARAVVIVQMLFDLVFVASAVGLVTSGLIARAQQARSAPTEESPP